MDHDKLPCHGKFCGRTGLPILPLVIAYVPNGLQNLPAGILHGSYGKGIRGQGVHANLTDGRPMLRVITEGYIFIHDARPEIGWRAFQATASGRFKEVTIADDERPRKQPVFGCTRDGDNLEASLINIEHPDRAKGEVWVGYSRVWWTKTVRKKMVTDSSLRSVYMVSVDAKSLYDGKDPSAEIGFRVDAAGAALNNILEYQNLHKTAAALYANTTSPVALDRAKEASPLAKRMYTLSKHGGIALALPDPVGLAANAAHWRNIRAGELAHFQVAQANMRERMVGDLILGLKKSMEDKGQAEEWSDRYAPKVDLDKVQADKAAYDKKINNLTLPIYRASTDWLSVVTREIFWQAWLAYDGKDKECGLAMERDFALCVKGSGALKKEQEWWEPWLTAAPDDDKHPLWKAIAAGDKDVVDYLKEKKGDALDIYKNAKEGKEKFKEWLAERRAQGLLRESTEASGVIGSLIAGQLPRLLEQKAAQVAVIGARLRVIMAVRTDTFITPYNIKISVKQMVAMLYETAWGPPSAKMSAKVLEARRALITQDMDGGFVEGRFSSLKVVELDIWLPEEQLKLAANDALHALPGMGKTLALPAPALNPYDAMRKYLSTGEAKLVGLGGALALFNLVSALGSLKKAMNAGGPKASDELEESAYGVVSGVLAVSATIGEITGAVMKRRVVAGIAKSAMAELSTKAAFLGLGGGLLGAGAAWTESIHDLCKGLKLGRDGDADAAASYISAGAMFWVSGAASAATSIIAAGTLLGAAGATGTLASMVISTGSVLAFIPVWGWIALGIVTLVAGIYLAFKAMTEEDTPLEIWLSRCCYRNASYKTTERKLFADAKVEMEAFQRAVYGLQITLEWSDSWFASKDEVEVRVIMPGYGKSSDYAYALQARSDKWAWQDIDRKASAFSSDKDLQPRQQQLYFSAVKPGQKFIPMDEVIEFTEPLRFSQENGMATLQGKIALNPSYLNHARLKFEYWPDAANHPELDMTPMPNGINFQEVKA